MISLPYTKRQQKVIQIKMVLTMWATGSRWNKDGINNEWHFPRNGLLVIGVYKQVNKNEKKHSERINGHKGQGPEGFAFTFQETRW